MYLQSSGIDTRETGVCGQHGIKHFKLMPDAIQMATIPMPFILVVEIHFCNDFKFNFGSFGMRRSPDSQKGNKKNWMNTERKKITLKYK